MTSFRLAYVPGATPAKWVRTWGERQPDVPLELVPVAAADATELIRSRGADAALLRSPIDRDGLHAIPLYTETTVVVVPKDHLIAAAGEVSTADLADDVVLHPLDDTIEWSALPGRPAVSRPESTADAVELVAAGVGVLVVPQSLARLHHRRDLTYRTVTDAPQSSVALSWPEDETTDLMETFIGIVRGRTVNSTRGRRQQPAEKKRPERKPPAPKKPAARRTGGGAPKRGKPRRKS
ncbi:LysR substrate-binding domain-containing protein [Amycolatopsis sp. MEPSY49]|uniref:LysR substrate-binding domain-containing protein n=1 Tax=Amycolatopsis sp. MEPSY49 TaxID=3151600 RepID=UPI003EF5FE13